MEKFIILPDVACDLSLDIRERFGVQDYVPGYTQINGENLVTTLDWTNISREDFYKTLGNKKNRVSSSAPNPEDYYQKFKKYVEQGYAILSISISSKIEAFMWRASCLPTQFFCSICCKGNLERIATPLYPACPYKAMYLYPIFLILSKGKSSSFALTSCKQIISGETNDDNSSKESNRIRIEFTFQVTSLKELIIYLFFL